MKLLKEDIRFSKYIRTRDKWRCVRCGTQYTPPTQGLHCSHFYGRSTWSTRFDEENCDAVCNGCHRYWGGQTSREGGKVEYKAFKLKQLGGERFYALTMRSNESGNRRKILEWAYPHYKALLEKEK